MDWYPWYFDLYRAKTRHLSLAEDGAYRRLIDEYMRTRQPLPNSDAVLASICLINLEQWLTVAPVVRRFFRVVRGHLRNRRCDLVLEDQDKRTRIHSEKSKKGAAARWAKSRRYMPAAKPGAIPAAMPKDATGQDRTGDSLAGKRDSQDKRDSIQLREGADAKVVPLKP